MNNDQTTSGLDRNDDTTGRVDLLERTRLTEPANPKEPIDRCEPQPEEGFTRLHRGRLHPPRWRAVAGLLPWLNIGLVTAIVVSAIFRNELASQDYDPMYMRDLVERAARFGGTYYENGIHNKGPLEPMIYQFARIISSWDSYWFTISAFVLIAAISLGLCVAHTASLVAGKRIWLGAIAMVVVVHFTLSGADYAGVLYSRNYTVVFLAISFSLITRHSIWSGDSRLPAKYAGPLIGFLLGISAQTLTTAGLSAAVMVAGAWYLVDAPKTPLRSRRFRVIVIAAGTTFISAPIYYAVLGKWSIFWNSWWVYGTFMTRATGRSLAGQLALGWRSFYAYYQARPVAAIGIALFFASAALGRHKRNRPTQIAYLMIAGWWFAACLEITLTQRYSSHYYSVTTVPTFMMGAALLGEYLATLPSRASTRRTNSTVMLAATVGALFLSGTVPFFDGLYKAAGFRSFASYHQAHEQGASGPTQSTRALLDLVSRPGDPLLMWTNTPWGYLNYHRVSATRFIWKSFLMGEIYLGRTSQEWILPHSWDYWAADVAQTNPVAYTEEGNEKVDPTTPAATYIVNNFTKVLDTGSGSVFIRNDVAKELMAPAVLASNWSPPAALSNGWNSTPTTLDYRGTAGSESTKTAFAVRKCYRLDAVMNPVNGKRWSVSLRFEDPKQLSDPSPAREPRNLTLDETVASSSSDNVEFMRSPISETNGQSVPFSFVVGKDSAALIVDGHVGSAVRISTQTLQFLQPHGQDVSISDLRVSPIKGMAGC